MNEKYETHLVENLISVLREFEEHTKNEKTDAHKDFYPDKISPLGKSLEILERETVLTSDLIKKLSEILGFKRRFVVLEMAEKILELEDTVLKDQERVIFSYMNWGIEKKFLEEVKKKYELILKKSVWEGLFRKGISPSDKDAWKSIRYNKQGRTIYEYIFAIVKGWIHEDVVSVWLKEKLSDLENIKDVSIVAFAHDKERVFKYHKTKKITGEPDFKLSMKINGNSKEIVVEIQHVTDSSRVKKDDLIQVPSHRVKESKKYGEGYIIIIPYVKKGLAKNVAVIKGPLKEERKNYIKGLFLDPNEEPTKLFPFLIDN